jgi:hypothetical protein
VTSAGGRPVLEPPIRKGPHKGLFVVLVGVSKWRSAWPVPGTFRHPREPSTLARDDADRTIPAWLDAPRTDRLGVLAVGCVAGVGAIASRCRAHIPGRCEISGSPVEIRRCSRNCEAPSGDKPGTLLTPRCKPSEEGVARVAVRRPPETSLLRISRRFFYVTCGAHRGCGGGCAVCVGSYASAAGSPLLPVAPMTSSSETTPAGSCSGE